MIVGMTVVRINAITVPADGGDELARRFAARAGAVDKQDGFEGFELLKPTDGRNTWLVVTRWRDEAAFQTWMHSPAFGHGHRSAAERAGGEASPPVGTGSELWSYEVAGGSSRLGLWADTSFLREMPVPAAARLPPPRPGSPVMTWGRRGRPCGP
jgi:heme-degrading monooxygenase HmoA